MDFSLGAEMTTARLIIEYITASSSRQLVNVFRGRMKLLSLFRAIGRIERETFASHLQSMIKPRSLIGRSVIEKCL